MRKLNMFLLSGLLLAACNTGLQPTNEDNTEPVVGKRKRVEEKEETNAAGYKRKRVDSELVVILPEKSHEEKSIVENLTSCSAERQEAPLLERNGFVFYESELPDEVMLEVFSRLSVLDIAQASQVCRGWYQLSEEPYLWRAVRLRIHGDYPENQATRENAKLHWLRVHVNTLSEPDKIAYLVTKYQLNNGHPFAKYKKLEVFNTEENIDERAAQGDKKALGQKLERLDDLFNEEKNKDKVSEQARLDMLSLIDRLAEEGHETALYMRIESLTSADAVDLLDRLAEQGKEEAIKLKLSGLAYGDYGYEEDQEAAIAFNERLVEQGNEAAIERKIEGLAGIMADEEPGGYGYEYDEDQENVYNLNEHLVKQGNIAAIKRKIQGLADDRREDGRYGYEEDQEAAVALNDHLVEQGNQWAIKRKIAGLYNGKYGYDKERTAAIALQERLIEQGNEAVIKQKISSLTYLYGQHKLDYDRGEYDRG